MRFAVPAPVVRDSDPSDEADRAINREKFPMRPVIHLPELIEPKNLHFDARPLQQFHFAPPQAIAAERVL